MAERRNAGAFLLGFIFGMATGAVAALLYAPGSGEETVERIRERGTKLKGWMDELRQETLQKTGDIEDEARRRADEMTKEAKERVRALEEEAKRQAEQLAQQGRTLLEEQKESLQEAAEGVKNAVAREPSEETSDGDGRSAEA